MGAADIVQLQLGAEQAHCSCSAFAIFAILLTQVRRLEERVDDGGSRQASADVAARELPWGSEPVRTIGWGSKADPAAGALVA